LPGRQERKIFTELAGQHAGELNDALGRIGFRRSQSVAYRPSCAGCTACVSVRVVATSSSPTPPAQAAQAPFRSRDHSLQALGDRRAVRTAPPLSRRPPSRRRHGRYGRERLCRHGRAIAGQQLCHRISRARADGQRGRLVGACITDQQADGLSMIYSFFDADDEDRPGLGNFIIMEHILRASAAGLPYVYLGYWVKGSERMAYKTRYRPIEVLGPNGWTVLEDEDIAISMPVPQTASAFA
jgi:arginyl-tRNA--protein-N-Asp/Glu arginylyltransferase